MALRAATMSPANASSTARRPALLRKLILLFLLVSAAALGLVFLFRQERRLPLLALIFFADAVLGMASGLGARTVLRRRNAFIRFVSAAAALIVGLYVLGYFTNWEIGIGPLGFGQSEINWGSLSQLAIGFGTALMALAAWYQPVPRIVEKPPSRPPGTPRRSKRRRKPHLPAISLPGLPFSKVGTIQRKAGARSKAASRAHGGVRAGVSAQSKVMVGRAPARSRRRSAFQRKPEVQLHTVEELRCPYCLQEIEAHDPRGVVECDICHTPHHADCWAIAGACQVPHYNA